MNPKRLYHLHHKEYTEDLAFWQGLSNQVKGAILELGCGSGRVLLPLAQSGATIWGVDIDGDLLAILAEEQAELNISNLPTIIEADFTEMQLEEKFALIIMPCNTYSTLTREARRVLIESIKQHLFPGGRVVISMPNPALLAELPPESIPEVESAITHPESGEPVQVSSGWLKEGDELQFFWHYDHILGDGSVERATASTIHHLQPWEAYEQVLIEAGFALETWGDFDRSPIDEDSPYIIFSGHLR